MTHLGLADAVDAPEALLQAVGVPRQVVVDHEVGALQVDTLAGGVGRHEDAHVGVLLERLLRAVSLVARHAALDGEHRAGVAQERADLPGEVVERVLVLREDDELLAAPVRAEHVGVVLQEARELLPLAVLAAHAHVVGLALEHAQGGDLRLKLGRGSRGRGGVDDVVLHLLVFVRAIVVLVEVLGVDVPLVGVGDLAARRALRLGKLGLQAHAAAPERLVDGLGARRQAALQDGEGKADAAAVLAAQALGAVELLGDVLRHEVVELLLGGREVVLDGVGKALGEQRPPIKLKQLLLHEAAHHI